MPPDLKNFNNGQKLLIMSLILRLSILLILKLKKFILNLWLLDLNKFGYKSLPLPKTSLSLYLIAIEVDTLNNLIVII